MSSYNAEPWKVFPLVPLSLLKCRRENWDAEEKTEMPPQQWPPTMTTMTYYNDYNDILQWLQCLQWPPTMILHCLVLAWCQRRGLTSPLDHRRQYCIARSVFHCQSGARQCHITAITENKVTMTSQWLQWHTTMTTMTYYNDYNA